jgi:HK97 family phage prohead protease
MAEKETKNIGGRVLEVKQIDRAGIPIGVVEGHIATWDIDRGDDKFIKGAFLDSIAEHKRIGKKQIPLKDFHGNTVGGWPIEQLKEDATGLFGVAEINLELEQGRDVYSLAKFGVYDSFSIGFWPIDIAFENDLRIISKAEILEGSILDVPMNPHAQVTEVKAVVPFQDLPLAPRDRAWNSGAANARIREWAGAQDGLESESIIKKYLRAFFWYDREDAENFSAYKLPYVDVVDGELMAIPRGVFAAAGAMQGARGGVDIPEGERAGVIRHIERYYKKMDLESPFENDGKCFRVDDIKSLTEREIERLLSNGVRFSQKTAKALTSILKSELHRDGEGEEHRDGDWNDVVKKLDEITKSLEVK